MPIDFNEIGASGLSDDKSTSEKSGTAMTATNESWPTSSDETAPIMADESWSALSNHTDTPSGKAAETDPNKVVVTISDHDTPIVVLYGPPACGKTMILVRLSRFLKEQGYTIVPDKVFRDSEDANYSKLCDEFDTLIGSNEAAASTSRISFLLVKVLFKGRPICQILEAPGEHYYDPDTGGSAYPPYLNRVINEKNRKVWAVVVEPNRGSTTYRTGYVDNIKRLKHKIGRRNDSFVFVYNKVDKTYANRESDAIKEVSDQYPGIFKSFENEHPITKLWKQYRCGFVCFSTGDYSQAADGTLSYEASADMYPHQLWNILRKAING